MLEGAPVAQTGPGFLTVPLLVAALVLQLEVGSHTLLILGILAAWLSSPGGLNIVFSALKHRPEHPKAKLCHKNDVF